jgi:high affinity sulfate transporter 1
MKPPAPLPAASPPAPAAGKLGVFAFLGWFKEYRPAWLRADLAAGITLAAYLLPAALGDASLAGLPPQAGLYACLYGGLFFWIFCSSRHTSITVTSAISLLIGTTLGGMAGGDPARFAALAACTAMITAAIAFLAWLAKAGSAVAFISESVMLGFKAGVALHLISTQLPKLCGVKGGHGDFWERMHVFFQHVGGTNGYALLLGVAGMIAMVAGKKYLPHKPVALFVVIGGILSVALWDFKAAGVSVLGEVPQGLPVPSLPAVHPRDLRELFPLALACFMLGAVESSAIARMFAAKHGYRVDNNQELLALSAANLASGFGHGYPISGGMSQSLVNESSGARTPLSGLIAAGILLLVALFFTGLLRDLPQPVLAAIVIIAGSGLFKVRELGRLWHAHRQEFFIAMAALLGVLSAGLLKGVLIGAVISLILLIRRASSPHVAFLGRIPGTRIYSDIGRHPDNETTPGILPFRVEASLVYFNVEHVVDTVLAKVAAAAIPIQRVICDLSTSPVVDLAGARMLLQLHGELAKKGIIFQVVEAHAAVRDILRVEGLDRVTGPIDRHVTLDDLIGSPHSSTTNPTP